jgi:Tfp pilus tip-associated adhesin PilY1
VNETADDCGALAGGCRQLKNALQADPVTTGRGSQRFITTAYLGDLDGSVWRVNLQLDASLAPTLSALTRVYPATPGAADQPIFNSMATTSDGANQYVFFGTGSDLLPSTGADTAYHFIGINDNGTLPSPKQVDIALARQGSAGVDEGISAFPAIAGDTVFFTTTTMATTSSCQAPLAKLYAVTFTGGPAYDTNKDHLLNSNDSATLAEVVGARATAPFIVDQHLLFGSGGTVALFGDPFDFNHGIGNAGVRILSWREVR